MIAQEVLLPPMGEGIIEATLVKWLKNSGETVQKGEALLEVSTDKVDTEIPSPFTGTLLKQTSLAGTTVEVNSTIGWIGDVGAVIPETTQAAALPRPSSSNKTSSSMPQSNRQSRPQDERSLQRRATHRRVDESIQEGPLLLRTSPLVRKMATEMSIDLRRVPGTGVGGRITSDDLLNFAESPEAWASNSDNFISDSRRTTKNYTLTQVGQDGGETLEGVTVKREPLSKIRRLIADHMVDSVILSPHVSTAFEIDLSKVVRSREALKSKFQSSFGQNLTYTHYLIYAAVQAIKKHPIVNVSVDGHDILWKEQINVGCAVALGPEGGGGLIVPVIKSANNMSLKDIALKLNDLATRARSKKLQPDEAIGGTFSITNPGGWGSIFSNPIINQPQVAMLGIGAIVKRPVVVNDDKIEIRPMMIATLTFDHRVIDGEGGAMWLASFKSIVENWEEPDI